jgi:hypothetical protein
MDVVALLEQLSNGGMRGQLRMVGAWRATRVSLRYELYLGTIRATPGQPTSVKPQHF